MRGLAMALFALDVPGRHGSLFANHRAGWFGVPFLSHAVIGTSTTKTISKKTTLKTV